MNVSARARASSRLEFHAYRGQRGTRPTQRVVSHAHCHAHCQIVGARAIDTPYACATRQSPPCVRRSHSWVCVQQDTCVAAVRLRSRKQSPHLRATSQRPRAPSVPARSHVARLSDRAMRCAQSGAAETRACVNKIHARDACIIGTRIAVATVREAHLPSIPFRAAAARSARARCELCEACLRPLPCRGDNGHGRGTGGGGGRGGRDVPQTSPMLLCGGAHKQSGAVRARITACPYRSRAQRVCRNLGSGGLGSDTGRRASRVAKVACADMLPCLSTMMLDICSRIPPKRSARLSRVSV